MGMYGCTSLETAYESRFTDLTNSLNEKLSVFWLVAESNLLYF